MNQNFDWMVREQVYEPRSRLAQAQPRAISLPYSIRRRRRIKVALWIACLTFVVCCGLCGLHWNGPQL